MILGLKIGDEVSVRISRKRKILNDNEGGVAFAKSVSFVGW